jgi:hypothetical protein
LKTHIDTQTYSAVSSVPVDNVFTSKYKNYKIVIRSSQSSAFTVARFRNGGTPDSGSVYIKQSIIAESTSVSAVTNTATNLGIADSPASTHNNVFGVLEICNPQLTQNTYVISNFRTDLPSAGIRGTIVNTVTAYDGIEFLASSGNISGEFSIYGYKR